MREIRPSDMPDYTDHIRQVNTTTK